MDDGVELQEGSERWSWVLWYKDDEGCADRGHEWSLAACVEHAEPLACFLHSKRVHLEEVTLKFIDTSSKFGHGRFQTVDEKNKFLGLRKKKMAV